MAITSHPVTGDNVEQDDLGVVDLAEDKELASPLLREEGQRPAAGTRGITLLCVVEQWTTKKKLHSRARGMNETALDSLVGQGVDGPAQVGQHLVGPQARPGDDVQEQHLGQLLLGDARRHLGESLCRTESRTSYKRCRSAGEQTRPQAPFMYLMCQAQRAGRTLLMGATMVAWRAGLDRAPWRPAATTALPSSARLGVAATSSAQSQATERERT